LLVSGISRRAKDLYRSTMLLRDIAGLAAAVTALCSSGATGSYCVSY